MDETIPIESKMISRSIEKAQERVEGHHFDTRKHVLQYDDVLNRHREAMYAKRDALLHETDNPIASVYEMIENEVERVVLFHTSEQDTADVPEQFVKQKDHGDWDPKEILESLSTITPVPERVAKDIRETLTEISKDQEKLAQQRTHVIEKFMTVVDEKMEALKEKAEDDEKTAKVLRTMMLRTNDNLWVDHLETMTYLRRSIGLQGYGQRDPLVEYKKESFGIFNQMQETVEREVVYNVFKVADQMIATQAFLAAAPSILERAGLVFSGAQKTMAKKAAMQMAKSAMAGAAPSPLSKGGQRGVGETVKSSVPKVGRNDDCPCGAVKPDGTPMKYKHCHGV